MADARKELRGLVQFSEGLKNIGSSLTTYVSAPLALFGAAAVVASAKVEGLRKGLEAITLQDLGKQGVSGLAAVQRSAQLTGQRMQELQVLARAPGLGFEQAVQGDVRLRAVGISAEQSAKSIKAFANAIATTGGGKNEFDRVTVQLAQLSAKGKVLAQDLRPIIEAAPAVSGALQKLYGTVDSETISASLQKQGQSSTDFIRILTDELGKLPQVTGGLKNAFDNLVDTGTFALAKFGDGISKALNLPAVLDSVSNFVSGIADAFANLSPGVQQAVVVFAGLVAATGPVLVAIGTLGAALPFITAGFTALGISTLAAAAPLVAGAALIGGAAYLIISNWDAVKTYFQGEGGRVFSDLAAAVVDAATTIGQVFANLGSDNLGSLINAGTLIKTLFQELAVGITAALNTVTGVVKVVASLLAGDLSTAADGAAQAFNGLLAPLENLLGLQRTTTAVTAQFTSGVLAARTETALFGDVLGLNVAKTRDFASGILSSAEAAGLLAVQAGGAARQVGILAGLEAKLKEAKDKRQNDTSVRDITADNAVIKSLQEQINKLEGVEKSGKKATDALGKLRQELATLSALDTVLARPAEGIDTVSRRVKVLESGLKSLLDAGISPTSAAFKAFATEALTLQQGLAKLKADSQLEFKATGAVKLAYTFGDNVDEVFRKTLSPELAAHPLEIPFVLKKLKTDFSGDILAATAEVERGMQAAADASIVFGGSFDVAGTKAGLLQQQLEKLLAAGVNPLAPGFRELGAAYRESANLANINQAATAALANGLSQLGVGLLEGLGQLAGGSATLADFGATILGLVGKLATQLGEAIVAVGIGMLGLKTAFTNPFGAIAAGAALIVVGAALSSIASSAANSGGGGISTSSITGSSAAPAPPRQTIAANAVAGPVTVVHKVELTARGGDLVGVLNTAQNRNARIVGSGG